MKQMKLTKKLVLNKETIVNIDRPDMKGLIGGATMNTQCYPYCTYHKTNCIGGCVTPATGCEPNCTAYPCEI